MAHRLCAEPQTRAGLAVFGGKFDFDDLVGSIVDRWGPATAGVSLWAGGLLVFPVDEKVIGIEACLLTGLPLMIAAGWTYQVDLIVLLTIHEQFGIHISGIDNMLLCESSPYA